MIARSEVIQFPDVRKASILLPSTLKTGNCHPCKLGPEIHSKQMVGGWVSDSLEL